MSEMQSKVSEGEAAPIIGAPIYHPTSPAAEIIFGKQYKFVGCKRSCMHEIGFQCDCECHR